ncbi:MAG TPA: acetolactate synthase large subunit [Burkholderiaceae bacterium]|nr:acetolactate synthase large subunit [Burkholderiaceae bacterium]
MNGAERLVRTLLDESVDVCFTNPGTSEMHFVAALDRVDGMRCVLGLFEGVVTGAADGYWRMARRPASTLLHLGPGLANGLANLHNARKARSGIVNVVGEHARAHVALDAPLTSDIEAIARPMSHWVQTIGSPAGVEVAARAAVQAATEPPGRIATLVLPADCAWTEEPAGAPRVARAPRPAAAAPDAEAIEAAAAVLRSGEPTVLLLGGEACHEAGLEIAGRIAAASGCALMTEFAVARVARGAGRVAAQRVPYVVDAAVAALAPYRNIVLVGAREPVSFFAYPGKRGRQAAPGTRVVEVADATQDPTAALAGLAEALEARRLAPARVAERGAVEAPDGPMSLEGIGRVVAAVLPEQAVVVDESVSSGRGFGGPTAGAAPHDWLTGTGGSIGFGLPTAIGAAIAVPGRKVLALEGDGSAMYTVQSLWTMAREGLDVTVLVFANRSYRILLGEYAGVGAGSPGPRATDMLSIDRPTIDWVGLARSMGVEAGRASDLGELARELRRGFASPGPYLVEAVL